MLYTAPVTSVATPTSTQPITLALDTSTPYLTLALRWPHGELERSEHIERAHAERLPIGVQDLFAAAGQEFYAQRIVIGSGPGSYTGVRIGASYALALARVWKAELVGVSTLTSLLTQESGLQATALDARRGHVYGALYEIDRTGIIHERQAPAKSAAAEFMAHAQAKGATPRLGPAPTVPSGLNLIQAAQTLGITEPQLHLSYL